MLMKMQVEDEETVDDFESICRIVVDKYMSLN